VSGALVVVADVGVPLLAAVPIFPVLHFSLDGFLEAGFVGLLPVLYGDVLHEPVGVVRSNLECIPVLEFFPDEAVELVYLVDCGFDGVLAVAFGFVDVFADVEQPFHQCCM